MKVIYKKTVIEKMTDAIFEARAENKIIEKFQLTLEEWREFKEIVKPYLLQIYPEYKDRSSVYYAGIFVECVN